MAPLVEKSRQIMHNLTDPRFIGQGVFLVIVLLFSWNSVKVIHANYQLQQQIGQLQQENEIKKLENENQRLKNDYYRSAQYLELSARQNYGLAAPGEKELLVPKNVALAHVPVEIQAAEGGVLPLQNTASGKESNLQAWLNFFLHRRSKEP